MTPKPVSRLRRLALAGTALTCAAFLFRANVASALVTRGDDFLRAGDVDGAVRSYARAAAFDQHSAVAADRLAFFLLLRHHPSDDARAFAVATNALRNARQDAAMHDAPLVAALLVDRALAAVRLGRLRAASHDLDAAAVLAHDMRYVRLAARLAARTQRRATRAQ